MDQTARSAFIIAQAACGKIPNWTGEDLRNIQYAYHISHNAVVGYLKDG